MTEKYLSLYREKVPAIDNEVEVYTGPVVDLEMRGALPFSSTQLRHDTP
jgi:hypothetical protein